VINTILLFTQKIPFRGGETFLETEIMFLASSFDKVHVFPLEKGDEYSIILPENVIVNEIPQQSNKPLKKLIWNHFGIILRYFLQAITGSKHQLKYITQFSFNWNRLMGILNQSNNIIHFFKSNNNYVFYSYWFNEWASALAISRQMGLKGKYIRRAHGYDYDELQNGRGYVPFRESEVKQFDGIVHILACGMHKMQNQFPNAKNIFLSRLGDLMSQNSPMLGPFLAMGLLGGTLAYPNQNIQGTLLQKLLGMAFQHRLLWAAMISCFFFLPLSGMHSPRTNIQFAMFGVLYGLTHLPGLINLSCERWSEANSRFVSGLILMVFIVIGSSQVFDARYVKGQLALRDAKLKSMRGQSVVLTEEDFVRTPTTRRFEDLATDSSYWLNQCVADHYGLKSIKLIDRRPKVLSYGTSTE
jgi:hypothetical protein